MKNWKKENKIKMTVTYSLDKYREGEDWRSSLEEITGLWAYMNNPLTSTFITLEINDEIVCISRDLVMKMVFHNTPKWNQITESQVVDSARLRKLNLDNELEIGKNTFDQEKRMRDTKGDGVV